MKRLGLVISLMMIASVLLSACGPEAEPEIVEVTRIVVETVVETVLVEGTPQIVEREVTKVVREEVTVEVEVEVEVEKVVTATPEPQEPVVILQGAGVMTLDPHWGSGIPTVNAQIHVFQTLTRFNANVELEPYMAESWTAVDDVTWEFKIKEGYSFHNGEPVNAEAFKYSLDRGQNMFETGDGRVSYDYALLNLDEVIVVDEYTLQIVTIAPNPILPNGVAQVMTAVLPRLYIEEVGDEEFGLTGIGSGPYIITEFIPDEIVVMEAWEGYKDGPPSIQTSPMPKNMRRIPSTRRRASTWLRSTVCAACSLAWGRVRAGIRRSRTYACDRPSTMHSTAMP